MKKAILFVSLVSFLLIELSSAKATCFVYFTGIGCPHCARTDPVIFKQLINKYNLTIIEYEIYQTKNNGRIMLEYASTYNKDWYGIPLVIFSKDTYIIGDTPILNNIEKVIAKESNNTCLLLNGSLQPKKLNVNALPGNPKIWRKNRVLVKGTTYLDPSIALQLLFSKNPTKTLKKFDLKPVKPCMPYSGGEVCFQHGVKFNGNWIFVWNGKGIEGILNNSESIGVQEKNISTSKATPLTLSKIVSLAAVDAVNPCALAVLTLMLIAIMSYNPRKKYKVLLAGLSFSFSVYIMYLLYGLIIVKFFQIVSQLVLIKLYLYKALAAFAVILGILNLKDAISYEPGGLLREMPLSWRPKVKKIVSGVTSPLGASLVGFFVTVFLLPCTMGPYVIAGGLLSAMEMLKALPWLLLYNLIFILPMLGITFAVYLGYTTVEKVSGWKDKNIRYLHATAGAIMLLLGGLMLLGVI